MWTSKRSPQNDFQNYRPITAIGRSLFVFNGNFNGEMARFWISWRKMTQIWSIWFQLISSLSLSFSVVDMVMDMEDSPEQTRSHIELSKQGKFWPCKSLPQIGKSLQYCFVHLRLVSEHIIMLNVCHHRKSSKDVGCGSGIRWIFTLLALDLSCGWS